MHFNALVFWLVCNIYSNEFCFAFQGSNSDKVKPEQNLASSKVEDGYDGKSDTVSGSHHDILVDTCSLEDFACLAMAASDRLGLEAIKALHQKLDDDANGDVDLSESNDFLREELKYDTGYEKRQKAFHRNNDMHISVKELWEAWLKSEVHNWTIEQTADWLTSSVELPQYVPNFIQNKVTGANLPRMAVNNMNYLNHLGIKDPIHKQKLALKAMDVVLFGPPKDSQAYWKDLILIILIIGGGIGSWYAVQQNKKFKNHLNRMNKDMDSLQNAEKALENLQRELIEAKQAQESVISEKENLEKKLQSSKSESGSLHNSCSDLEISQLKAEIEMLRSELQLAEGELKDRCWTPPGALQQWLQLTHEIENKSYIKKKLQAEKQLQHAREACEKLRKKRSSLVGAFVSTHGKSIDEVDRSIVEARTSLNEVTQELQERMFRWKQIEMLCGFNIMTNSGLQYLENALYRNSNGRASNLIKGRMNSQDDLDDDTISIYSNHPGIAESGLTHQHSWKEGDSSESEVSKDDEPLKEREPKPLGGQTSVHFLVGGEITHLADETLPHIKLGKLSGSTRSTSHTSIGVTNSKIQAGMQRSLSQDTNMTLAETLQRQKTSQSDNSLDSQAKLKHVRQKMIQEQSSTNASIEEDVCSTDSSLMEDEIKKKKRKLFSFAKKPKKE